MYLIVIHLSIIEIAVLFAGAIVLGLAIHFFIINRRSLQEAIEETKQKTIRPGYTPPSTTKPSRQIDAPVPAPLKESRRAHVIAEHERVVAIKPKTIAREESVENLKETVLQQQKLL